MCVLRNLLLLVWETSLAGHTFHSISFCSRLLASDVLWHGIETRWTKEINLLSIKRWQINQKARKWKHLKKIRNLFYLFSYASLFKIRFHFHFHLHLLLHTLAMKRITLCTLTDSYIILICLRVLKSYDCMWACGVFCN